MTKKEFIIFELVADSLILKWAENYLREHGTLALLPTFDPNGEKLDKAKAFLEEYKSVLGTTGRIHELDKAVKDTYGKDLKELFGGE